jgi:hypothetical protein
VSYAEAGWQGHGELRIGSAVLKMASLARRNLLHDKVRLSVTLTGIVFALVLIAVQTGLSISFATTTCGFQPRAS